MKRAGETREPSERLRERGFPRAAKAQVALEARRSLAGSESQGC